MTRFYTGATGVGTGPHLDFRVYNPATGGYEDPSGFTNYLTVGDDGKPFDFGVSSGFQPGGRVHPVTGKIKPHLGIDYLTPEGTAINVDGRHLSTWEDKGGGVMSQYLVGEGENRRELLLLHGSRNNPITGTGAVTDYSVDDAGSPPNPSAPKGSEVIQDAKARAKSYSEMTKAQLDAAYDGMRSDTKKAEREGMAMHNAYFNK